MRYGVHQNDLSVDLTLSFFHSTNYLKHYTKILHGDIIEVRLFNIVVICFEFRFSQIYIVRKHVAICDLVSDVETVIILMV